MFAYSIQFSAFLSYSIEDFQKPPYIEEQTRLTTW